MALYDLSKISAEDVTDLCYYAAKSGMPGEVHHLGKKPGSGNYTRHLQDALGWTEEQSNMYKLEAPGYDSNNLGRGLVTFAADPLHERLAKRFEEPGARERLLNAIENTELPKSYYDHPVVLSTADPVWPYGIYLDGIAYSNTDSAVGIWLVDLITKKRDVLMVVRKRICCRCGCLGYCTFFIVLLFLQWGMEALKLGEYPSRRHDGAFWHDPEDNLRASLGGTRLLFKACCLQLRGDWAEFCERLGFPTPSSGMRPCFCCSAFGQNMYSIAGCTLDRLPDEWYLNGG